MKRDGEEVGVCSLASGMRGMQPLTNRKPLALMAWLYGPMAAGARSVEITSRLIFCLLAGGSSASGQEEDMRRGAAANGRGGRRGRGWTKGEKSVEEVREEEDDENEKIARRNKGR